MKKVTGRPALPTAQKIIRGNPGKQKLNDREPVVARGSVDPPPWVRGTALEMWNDLAPKFSAMGCLGDVDRLALAGACKWWGIYREADAALETGGLLHQSNANGLSPRPEIEIARKAWSECMAMLLRFGVTPGERARIRIQKEPVESKWGKLLAA